MKKLQLDSKINDILNCIHAGVLYCENDEHSTILYANDYFYTIVGYSKEEIQTLFQNRFADMVIDDVSEILVDVAASIERGEDLDFEYRMRHKDGREIWIHDTARYDKETNCFYVTIMDITYMKQMEYEKERLHQYLEYLPNKIVISDVHGEISYKNSQARQCSYFDPSAKYIHDLVDKHIIGIKFEDALNITKLGQNATYETRFKNESGFIGHDLNYLVPIYDKQSKQLNYMQVSENLISNSDTLTKFPARGMFEKYYETLMGFEELDNVHLCIIDIDDFKKINDSYGHLIGDHAIIHTANRLTKIMDSKDYICRFGGDEFLFLMVGKDIDYVKHQLQSFIKDDVLKIKNQCIPISYSIGIASTNYRRIPYQQLLQEADDMLYCVKENGKGSILSSSD